MKVKDFVAYVLECANNDGDREIKIAQVVFKKPTKKQDGSIVERITIKPNLSQPYYTIEAKNELQKR